MSGGVDSPLLTRREAAEFCRISLRSLERHVQPHVAFVVIGVFLIPMLYVVFQWLRERVAGRAAPAPKAALVAQTPAGIEGG